jgi:exosome complex component RRP40
MSALSSSDASLVLPGELVQASHPNLKLGPGLRQLISAETDARPVLTTRAGVLHHSPNGARWWVEGNARRVSAQFSSRGF